MASTLSVLPVRTVPSEIDFLWQSAISQYEQVTGISMGHLAQAKNIEQILAEIENKQALFKAHRHDKSKRDRLRTIVSESLPRVQLVGDILGKTSKAALPPSEAMFTAIKYLISASNNVSSDYDKIEGFFEELRSYLLALELWEDGMPQVPQVQIALAHVFSSILGLCAICTKYIKTKRIVKTFKSLAVGEDIELRVAYENFHRMVDREREVVRRLNVLNIETTKLQVQDTHTTVTQSLSLANRIDQNIHNVMNSTGRIDQYIKSQETAQERDSILSWISNLEFQGKQRSMFSKHQENTNQWFLNSPDFQKWLTGEEDLTLWCPGNPGSGKSVLTSTVISHIEDRSQPSTIAIAYVYCDYKDEETQSETKLLSSIVRQLAESCHPIPEEVKAFRDKYVQKRSYPPDEERVSLIKTLASRFSKTYILIDALDECREEIRDAFLCLVGEMEGCARIFLTSRPNVNLEGLFSSWITIEISANSSDIETYVEDAIKKNRRMSAFIARDRSLKRDIIQSILNSTKGMFLLAHLQIKELCRQNNAKAIRASLNSLPMDVNSFYDDALQRVESQNEMDRELAKKAFSYIFYAKRSLSVDEILHALSFTVGDCDVDEMSFTEDHILLSITAGLIQVGKHGTVSLVHLTLDEYFRKTQGRFLESQSEITKTCLGYLSFNVFGAGPCDSDETLDQRLSKYAFSSYASQYWGQHVVESQDAVDMEMVLDLLRDKEKLASTVQILHIPQHRVAQKHDMFPQGFTSLHAVAYWGMNDFLNSTCVIGIAINDQDSNGATALHLASRQGHVKTAQLLLEHDSIDIDMVNYRGETSLMCAARNGHGGLAELLLAGGANSRMEDEEGWTALHWAIIGSHSSVVKLFIDHATDTDTDKTQHNKAIILASEAGSDKTVEMLVSEGADVDWIDEEGSTPLHWAVSEGHELTVSVLLKNKADPNSKDNYDNTPLHWAVANSATTRLLLDCGARVNVGNRTLQTALHWSTQAGKDDVIELLLSHGADPNFVDSAGVTALHVAAMQGYVGTAERLIRCGADLELKDNDGWTASTAAIVKGHDDLAAVLTPEKIDGPLTIEELRLRKDNAKEWARMQEMAALKACWSTAVSGLRSAVNSGYRERILELLENGADIDADDPFGDHTALTLATWLGREELVKVLLENGADPNRRDRTGRAALHIAAGDGYLEILILLVENGADVDARMYEWTPMLLAAQNWKYWVIDHLIENRADVNAEDYNGRRALHWAARHGGTAVVWSLMESGAELNARDGSGKTALATAVENQHHKVADLLRNEFGAELI